MQSCPLTIELVKSCIYNITSQNYILNELHIALKIGLHKSFSGQIKFIKINLDVKNDPIILSRVH